MADPLSIASGVAGLVSFGLEVCRGLMEYYDQWKGYDADVTSLHNSIDNLVHILTHFEERLRNPSYMKPDAVKTVRSNIATCTEGLNRLEAKLHKVKARGGSGRLDKLDRFARRAIYPFKASTLAKLQEIVGELRQNLMAALGVLQVDNAILTAQKLDEISSGIAILQDSTAKFHITSAIKAWLKAPDPSSNYNTALGKRESTTGEWFVLSSDFMEWQNQPASVLWLHGDAGCGKTVLCSTIITATRLAAAKSASSTVLYYFFDFNDPAKQQAQHLLASLVQQLAVRDPHAQSILERLYDLHEGLQKPTLNQLLSTFVAMVQSSQLRHVYIIIDALDECNETEILTEQILRPMVDVNLVQIHVLATSRKTKEIRDTFDVLATKILPIESNVVDGDIKTFVTNQILRDHWWDKWKDNVRQEVIEKLVSQAKGMFRWAVCQLQEVRKSINVKMLKRSLNTLPKTLDATYSRALSNIDPEYVDYASRLLPWLCFSFRPINLHEANEVLAMKIGTSSSFDDEELLDDPYDMQQICSSLLTITTESPVRTKSSFNRTGSASPIIRLAHYSVKEFLVSDRLTQDCLMFKMSEGEAHAIITEICLRCLLRFNEEGSWSSEKAARYPLAQYAAAHWFRHFREIINTSESERLHQLALGLCRKDSKAYTSMLHIFDIDSAQLSSIEQVKGLVSPLYFCCAAGLASLAQKLLIGPFKGMHQQSPEGAFGSALKAAISRHDVFIVKVLLENHTSILDDRLIERPYKVTRIGPYTIIEPATIHGHSPLVVAAEEEDDSIINLLLNHMRPDETSVQDCGNALDVLASRPYHVNQNTLTRIIQLLFRSQERVRKQRSQLESDPSKEVREMRHSRNSEAASPGPKTPESTSQSEHHNGEHTNFYKEQTQVIWGENDTYLYEVDSPFSSEETGTAEVAMPAFVPAAAPTPEVAVIDGPHDDEIERDDSVTTSKVNWGSHDSYIYEEKERPFDRSDKYMDFPVRYVADSVKQGNATMLKALLAEGADVNTRHLGNTILYEACEAGYVECVETLLAAGADIHALNPEGNTHLQINSSMTVSGSPADENETALHAVARSVRRSNGVDFFEGPSRTSYSWIIMKLLLEAGGDPDVLSRNGDTPVSLWFFNVAEPLILEENAQGLTKVTADHELFRGRDLPNSRTAFELQYHAVHILNCAMRRRRHRLLQHVNYASFFLPFELRAHLEKHNEESERAYEIDEPLPEDVLDEEQPRQKHVFAFSDYHPFGTEPEDDPNMHPWPIPSLDVNNTIARSAFWTNPTITIDWVD